MTLAPHLAGPRQHGGPKPEDSAVECGSASVEGHGRPRGEGGRLQGHRGMEQAAAIQTGKWAGAESGCKRGREDSKGEGPDWSWGCVYSPFTGLHRAAFLRDPDVSQHTRCEPVCRGAE